MIYVGKLDSVGKNPAFTLDWGFDQIIAERYAMQRT